MDGEPTFKRGTNLVVGHEFTFSLLDALGLAALLLAQCALDRLNEALLGIFRLVDVLAVVQLAELEVDLHHVFLDARAIAIGDVHMAEFIDPAQGVGAHDLQHVTGHGILALFLEQRGDGVVDAHNLVAEWIHAQLGGQLQGLAKVLVRLSDVQVLPSAVEYGSTELLRDGFGEVVVGLLDNVVIVPGNVVRTPSSDSDDAATISFRSVTSCGRYLRHEGKGKGNWAPPELLTELLARRRLVSAREMLVDGLPSAGGQQVGSRWLGRLAVGSAGCSRSGPGHCSGKHGE